MVSEFFGRGTSNNSLFVGLKGCVNNEINAFNV